ncbi:MAG: bifunctional DNA primase/polymerase [Chloroflexia bacterium]
MGDDLILPLVHMDGAADVGKAALAYAQRGWPVLPIKGKVPIGQLVPHGYKDATTDSALLADWWATCPDAGVAIAPGRAGLLGLDIDPRNGGKSTLNSLTAQYGPAFKNTVTAYSGGGGLHFYYNAGGLELSSGTHAGGRGIDVKGRDGYLVAPPSMHETGARYTWVRGQSPFERDPALLPDWLAEMLSTNRVAKHELRKVANPALLGVALDRPAIDLNSIIAERGCLTGREIACTARDLAFVRAACSVLGIPDVPIGEAFCSVLPGQPDTHPSASLFQMHDGTYQYRDWREVAGRTWYTLPGIRQALATKKLPTEPLSDPEITTWHLRLLVETGYVRPASVDLRPLAPGASYTLLKVYDGFKLLLGCKWLYEFGQPTAFAWRFAAPWCGVAINTCRDAMAELLRQHIIKGVGHHRGTNLWLPTGY